MPQGDSTTKGQSPVPPGWSKGAGPGEVQEGKSKGIQGKVQGRSRGRPREWPRGVVQGGPRGEGSMGKYRDGCNLESLRMQSHYKQSTPAG